MSVFGDFLNVMAEPERIPAMLSLESHQQEIDDFYLKEFVSKMHPALQALAIDARVLRHSPESHPIASFAEIFGSDYMLQPWMLEDIFPIPAEQRMIVQQGYILLWVGYIILDHLVDQQLPDTPIMPLVYQHFTVDTVEVFAQLFDFQHPFWKEYHANMRELINVLALEYLHVVQRVAPFSPEVMKIAASAKATAFRTGAFALAALSNRMDILPTIHSAYNTMSLADQYGDDSADWRDDFLEKRATLPIFRLAEIEKIPLEAIFDLDPDDAEDRMLRSGILLDMCDSATAFLESAIAEMTTAGLGESQYASLLRKRLEDERFRKRNFTAITFLHRLGKSLSA